jgi:hypothetical protein
MIIAYSAGRYIQVEPAPVDVLPENAAEPPAAKPDAEPTDFTEYIDNLLASAEKKITGFS